MKAIRTQRWVRRGCWGLIALLVSGLVTPYWGAAWAATGRKTVLVLPVTSAAEAGPADLAVRAAGAIALALDATRTFEGMQFSPTSPSVRRAVSEGRIRQVDVEEGAKDVGTALLIGAALGADYVLMSTIQSYTWREEPAGVEIVLAGQMYEVAANINPTTGEPVAQPKVFRAFGVSGVSTGRGRYAGREELAAQDALRDAAAKAAAALAGLAEPKAVTRKTTAGQKWALLALLIAGAAIAIGSGGGNNAPTVSPEALPPTNLSLEERDEGIMLHWTPPTGTTLTLLQRPYRIERSVDGTGFVPLSEASNLPATATSFLDWRENLLTGTHVYQYRIQAWYAQGVASPWVNFGALTVTK